MMFYLLGVCALISIPNIIAIAIPNECPAGMELRYDNKTCCRKTTLNTETRIVGGLPAQQGQWPWLIYYYIFASQGTYLCGGTLVDASHVVTAAHCFISGARYLLMFGSVSRNPPSTNRRMIEEKDIVIHSGFRTDNLTGAVYNDIMIMTFPPLEGFYDDIAPLSLPNGEDPPVGMTCFTAGWGTTSLGGSMSDMQLEVGLDIQPFVACSEANGNTIDDSLHICAGVPQGGRDSCQGDSGSPLMCQRCENCEWYLAGIVSFGEGCGLSGIPGAYTRVSTFQEWLHKHGVERRNVRYDCSTLKFNDFQGAWSGSS